MKKIECPECSGYGTTMDDYGISRTCHACGAMGFVVDATPDPRDAELASLRAEVERLKAEHSQVAGALGCVHEQSMGECHAGTVDDMLCAIATLRGEIVILHSANARGASMVNEINVARAAFARRLGDALGISEDDSIIAAIEKLRADLARVTGERDEARTAARARGVWCPTCHALVHSDDEGTCVTCGDGGTLVVEEMADTLDRIAEIANATECYEVGEVVGHVQSLVEDRDEARAKVAGLTLPEDTIKTLLGALGEGVAPRGPRCFTSRYADAYDDLTRYAEALGVRS